MKSSLALLTILAAAWAGRLEAQVPIRDVRLTLDPVTYHGPCPARLRAHVVFVSNYPTRVDEDNWGWNFGRLAPHSWDVPGGHLRTSGRETSVDTTLTIPHAGETGGGFLHEGSVHVIMEINPTISNTVRYSVRCAPTVTLDPKILKPTTIAGAIPLQKAPAIPVPAGGGVGLAIHLPDLVVSALDPVAGTVAVTNTGAGPAAASGLGIRIRCLGDDGEGKTCVGRFAWPSGVGVDPALGGPVLPVPALAPGASRTIPVPSWATLSFTPGKYALIATADARSTVPESNESNSREARFTRP